jgi:hypothetical protein
MIAFPCRWRAARGTRALGLALAAMVAVAVAVASPASAEIHRCPRADGTMEYRDRPCGAGPADAPASAPPPAARTPRAAARKAKTGIDAPAASTAAAPAFVSPSLPTNDTNPDPATAPLTAPPSAAPAPAAAPATRAAYVARNEARCRDGDRRACAAVTCDRSGDLGSPACQEAVGYVRGRGWDLRPASDAFDADRARDDYVLTCRSTGRRAALSRTRGSDMFDWPGGPAPTVARTALAEAATSFCASR